MKIIFLCLLCHQTFARQSLLCQVRALLNCFFCVGDKHSLGSSALRRMELILISVYSAVVESKAVIMTLSLLGEREGGSLAFLMGSNYVNVCP